MRIGEFKLREKRGGVLGSKGVFGEKIFKYKDSDSYIAGAVTRVLLRMRELGVEVPTSTIVVYFDASMEEGKIVIEEYENKLARESSSSFSTITCGLDAKKFNKLGKKEKLEVFEHYFIKIVSYFRAGFEESLLEAFCGADLYFNYKEKSDKWHVITILERPKCDYLSDIRLVIKDLEGNIIIEQDLGEMNTLLVYERFGAIKMSKYRIKVEVRPWFRDKFEDLVFDFDR